MSAILYRPQCVNHWWMLLFSQGTSPLVVIGVSGLPRHHFTLKSKGSYMIDQFATGRVKVIFVQSGAVAERTTDDM